MFLRMINMDQPVMEGTVYEGRHEGLKKSRSNEGESSGRVEAGLGIWKDWSRLNQVDAVDSVRGSDTTCKRPPSIPLGYLARGKSESLSDKRLFFGRDEGGSSCTLGVTV